MRPACSCSSAERKRPKAAAAEPTGGRRSSSPVSVTNSFEDALLLLHENIPGKNERRWTVGERKVRASKRLGGVRGSGSSVGGSGRRERRRRPSEKSWSSRSSESESLS
mmetsp:Transcript_824/g.3440  ORF Transcript_824/g.3440 Transcript_824/m.3440 type:complete len:109 (+) Transcript_824:152-478(+)